MTSYNHSTSLPENRQPNGLAPSEKHLEDWIVAHWHDVPDAICHPNFIGRQIPLPSGILDIAYSGPRGILIVELKKDVIDGKAVAQCLRYMGDIRAYLFEMLMRLAEQELLTEDEFSFVISNYESIVSGMLIGTGFSDERLQAACDAAHIVMVDYDFNGGDYRLDLHKPSTVNGYDYADCQHGLLTAALKETLFDLADLGNIYKDVADKRGTDEP